MYNVKISWIDYYKTNAFRTEKVLVNIMGILTLLVGVIEAIGIIIIKYYPELYYQYSYEYFNSFSIPAYYLLFLIIRCVAYIVLGCLLLKLKNWVLAIIILGLNILFVIFDIAFENSFPNIAILILCMAVTIILRNLYKDYCNNNQTIDEQTNSNSLRKKLSKAMTIIVIIVFALQIGITGIMGGIEAVNEAPQQVDNYENVPNDIDKLIEDLQ